MLWLRTPQVAHGHSWEAGGGKFWMETYVLSFMKMALWILVKALSLTLDPSHPTENDTAISKGLKGAWHFHIRI